MTLSNRPALSASARRNLQFIESGIARGLSTSALQSALTAAGRGIRRTDLLTAVRHVRGVSLAGRGLRNIRRDRLPDPARIPRAATNIRRRYSFRLRVEGIDGNTGQRTTRFITVSSDTVLTRDQLEIDADDAINAEGSNYPTDIESVTLIDAVQRA